MSNHIMDSVELNISSFPPRKTSLAFLDIRDGLCSWRIWWLLSWQDVKLRYRRSHLGPFWITLSMAITIYSMAFLYGHLFHIDLKKYYPFLAAGMLSWTLISNMITESSRAFIEGENYLKQIKIPYIVFILRIVARNLIIFAHNILIIIPIYLFLHLSFNWHFFLLLPGLLLVSLNGVIFGLAFAQFGCRYRDVEQVISSLVQITFFLTPVMWNPVVLPAQYQFIVNINPIAQFIELIRAPLLGEIPSVHAIATVLMFTVVGAVLSMYLFNKFRHRIIYWL